MKSNCKQISPSLMCGDWLNVESMIKRFEGIGVEWLHIDIMDGHFVPNVTFGIDMVNQIKKLSHIPLDVHIMAFEPEKYIKWLNLDERDFVSFHYEATSSVDDVLQVLEEKNIHAGLALKPETDMDVIIPYLDKLYSVLLMLTVPGSYGKSIEPGMIEKIRKTNKIIKEAGSETLIEVDGSVSFLLAKEMSEAGANVFVAGTSSIFNSSVTLEEGADKLRHIIGL
jgi:ribulose-phosphate 3-epimerase